MPSHSSSPRSSRSSLAVLARAAAATGLALELVACGTGTTSSDGDAGRAVDAGVNVDAAESLDADTLDAGSTSDASSLDAAPPTDGGPSECALPLACDAPLPDLGATSDWRHSIATPTVTAMGAARHRGRDLYLRASDPQWALAKFAYGLADDDLTDEDVDVYLLRGCGTSWELLGTATTTDDGDHDTVEGVEDTGGRVYFEIPEAARLGIGQHRIAFVVRGDHTVAEQRIEVLPDDAHFVVTDVDGTQTESETAEWSAIFGGADPAAQPYGPESLWAFAARGDRIFYLTARPDWLGARTHAWLTSHGYPPGVVHTTLGGTGATGSAAQSFKTEELAAHLTRFPHSIDYAIGNTDTDAATYGAVGIDPSRAFLYQYEPGSLGTRIDDYAELVTLAESLPLVCAL